ncbi:MAG TPA: transposase [Bacteroidales bacterium]|nr:transposase [Bacteroidales bacterium]
MKILFRGFTIKEWQQRPLDPVYYVVWMDGIVVKVRQNDKVQGKNGLS